MLVNKKTGLEINENTVYSKDSNGITIKNYNCFKFIPWEDIEERYTKSREEYYSGEQVPDFHKQKIDHKFHSSEDEPESFYTEKARYRFGIKNIKFYERKFDKASAVCSEPVDVDGIEYISLSIKAEQCYNSSVEFYVLDGAVEQPILPEGTIEVKQEKLFYGLGTRFVADNSTVVLYEDGKPCSKNYLGISFSDYLEHEYTIDYVPLEPVYDYRPENNNIKIKMIIRNYTDMYSPAVIAGVTVNKHGGELTWN